jgi:hypothetical protein
MIAEELRVLVRAETQEAVRNLNRVEGSTNKADAGFKKIIKTLGAKAAALAAAAISIRAVTRLAQESIQLARRQVEAEQNLSSIIGALGGNVGQLTNQYRDFAGAIQEVTTVGDEAVLELLAAAEAFGLSGEQAESATEAALGLSQAFGIDANTALRAYTNAQQGNLQQLQRYIPAVREATSQTDAMNIINNAAAAGFEQLQGVTETSFGAIDQMNNSVGDLKEEIGITLADALEPMARSFGGLAGEIASTIRQSREYNEILRSMEGEGEAVSDVEHRLAVAMRERARISRDMEELTGIGQRARLEAERDRNEAVIRSLEQVRLTEALRASEVQENQRLEGESEEEALERMRRRAELDARRAEIAAELGREIAAIDEQHRAGLLDNAAALQEEEQARVRYLEALQGIGDPIENLLNVDSVVKLRQGIEQLRNPLEEVETETETIATAFSGLVADMDAATAALNDTGLAMEALRRRTMETRAQFDGMTEGPVARIQRMADEFRAAGVDMEELARWSAVQIAEHYAKTANTIFTSSSGAFSAIGTMLSSYTDRHIAEMERQKEATESRYSAEIEWAEAAGATDAEIAELKRSQAEESAKAEEEIAKKQAALALRQFRMDKSMQIGQATMAGATGVVQALAMAPPNVPLSIAIGALAGTQIAAIAATQPPAFEQGGSFVTSGPQMIMVGDGQSPRERVTVEPLSGPYRGSAGGGVNVTINGVVGSREEVASWVWDAIRKGQQRGAIRA